MKCKFSTQDIDTIFNHLDKDGNGYLTWREFTSLQKKLPKLEPENPYSSEATLTPSVPSINRPRSMGFEELETVANRMKLINHTATKNQMKRKGTIPKGLSESGHIFGMSSIPSQSGKSGASVGSGLKRHNSQMMDIMKHTDNLRDGLQRRIELKMQMDRLRSESQGMPIHNTKSSILRSASAMTSKMLVDMNA